MRNQKAVCRHAYRKHTIHEAQAMELGLNRRHIQLRVRESELQVRCRRRDARVRGAGRGRGLMGNRFGGAAAQHLLGAAPRRFAPQPAAVALAHTALCAHVQSVHRMIPINLAPAIKAIKAIKASERSDQSICEQRNEKKKERKKAERSIASLRRTNYSPDKRRRRPTRKCTRT